ncbi:MAG: DUF2779 domain-containing protein [Zetaproteobacteria bacterium]|nr:DUF2779 domain-containing protein [Zetaproteobacteria bacterium]
MPRLMTKSDFKRVRQCPTQLFYHRNPEQYTNQTSENPFLAALAEGGFQVGELAKLYYPQGHLIAHKDTSSAVKATRQALHQHTEVTLFEAAFCAAGFVIRVDILIKNQHHIQLIEVKSKSFDPKSPGRFFRPAGLRKGVHQLKKDWLAYLEDVAFQSYVVQQAHPDWKVTPKLMLPNPHGTAKVTGLNQNFELKRTPTGQPRVVVHHKLSPEVFGADLLGLYHVTEEVTQVHQSTAFQRQLNDLSAAIKTAQYIPSTLGSKCKTCAFRDDQQQQRSGFHQCWARYFQRAPTEIQGPFIFDLWNFKETDKYLQQGIWRLADLDSTNIRPSRRLGPGILPSERQQLQINSERHPNARKYVEKNFLSQQFRSWQYPYHFIDFETTRVAIPFHRGGRPYQQIAFQFSHHVLHRSGHIEHRGQYLHSQKGLFPNFDFVRELKRQLSTDEGTIFRYSSHENTVLCDIAQQLRESHLSDREELCTWIDTITHRHHKGRQIHQGHRDMVDLWEVVKKSIYLAEAQGSLSIKYMLPAILKDSSYLRQKYAHAIYGHECTIPSLNFDAIAWIQLDAQGNVRDPYQLLAEYAQTSTPELAEGLIIRDGGAAMTAYARLQFDSLTAAEREAVQKALLRYCELDTFAMVLLCEYMQQLIPALPTQHIHTSRTRTRSLSNSSI